MLKLFVSASSSHNTETVMTLFYGNDYFYYCVQNLETGLNLFSQKERKIPSNSFRYTSILTVSNGFGKLTAHIIKMSKAQVSFRSLMRRAINAIRDFFE